MNEELWTPKELKREQIHGAFVIGFMAVILIKGFPLSDSDYFKYIPYILFICWGIYLFLITISTSDDAMLDERLLYMRILQYLPDNRGKSKSDIILIVKNNLFKYKQDAHNMFILGIIFSMIYVSLVLWIIITTPRFSSVEDFINYILNAPHYVLNKIWDLFG